MDSHDLHGQEGKTPMALGVYCVACHADGGCRPREASMIH